MHSLGATLLLAPACCRKEKEIGSTGCAPMLPLSHVFCL
nr:MAG TPA: hypothetical protein [Caudoviricetes sp.]